MPLQDVTVSIDVVQPAPRVGLGRILILAEAVGAPTYTEYRSIDALSADYAMGTPTYAKAAAIYAQENHPDVVAVATYETGAVEATLNQFYTRGWHFVMLANDEAAEQRAVSAVVDGKGFKFHVAQVDGNTGREALADYSRTLIFDHDVPDEHLNAAAVSSIGSLTVGSVTWKFKGGFAGITPRYVSSAELAEIEADNAMAYVVKAGRGQLSDGITASGEFIDVLHGQDWVKVDMENEVQYALQSSPKLPYDARGIGVIEAAATTTLQRAFNNGIIAETADKTPDYSISTLSREEVDPQDRAERVYPGLSFEFGLAGAIHSARVKGTIRI